MQERKSLNDYHILLNIFHLYCRCILQLFLMLLYFISYDLLTISRLCNIILKLVCKNNVLSDIEQAMRNSAIYKSRITF